jgi:iron complex outermembrane recepter protein
MSLSSRLLSASALCSLFFVTPVFAQESLAQESSGEVIVTAQKKPERLSRTPLSVAVVTGEAMDKVYAHDLKDLQTLTPSLLITSTANEAQTTARLRGVGTVGDNPGLESSVGVVIDGVTRVRTATAMSDLGPIDRIEILKGPQSDVYGKGASAGVIQVVSKLPSFTPSQSLDLTVGNMGAYGVSAYATGTVSEHWAGSLSLVKRQRDGQYAVSTGEGPRTRNDDGDQNYWSARGQLLYVPNGSMRVRLIADYTKRDEVCCAGTAVVIGGTRAYIDSLATDEGTAAVADVHARRAWSNRPTDQSITDAGLSAQVDLKVTDNIQLTSVTAIRHWDHTNGYDADFSSADVYYRETDGGFGNRFDTVSQEVRLNGTTGKIDWMLGVFLDQEELTRRDQNLYGADYEAYIGLLLSAGTDANRVSTLTGRPVGQSFVQGQGARDVHQQTESNFAVFGHAEWDLSDTVSVQAGGRLNRQTKRLSSSYTTSDGGIACRSATASKGTICQPWANPAFTSFRLAQINGEDAGTGSLRVKWQATPAVMTYASLSQGWKGAGFNLDREQKSDLSIDTDTSFKAETSQSYEIGMKGRFLGNRLIFDVAAFDTHFRNFQLNTFLGTNFVVNSVPHLRSKGVELESQYHVGPVSLRAGAIYNEAKFGPEAIPGLALVANGTASFAPEWSAAYGIDYMGEVGGLAWTATLNGKYNSDYNTGSDLNPIKVQKAYTLYDGQVSFGAPDGRWALDLWGRNLTDVDYYQVVFSAPFQAGTFDAFMGQPRTYGLTLRLKR